MREDPPHEFFRSARRGAKSSAYAEADPSFDIDGIDAAHKLAISWRGVGFGRPVDLGGVYAEGIRHVSRLDIDFRRGTRLPHQASRDCAADRGRGWSSACILAWCFRSTPIAAVEGVFKRGRRRGRFLSAGWCWKVAARVPCRPPRPSPPISSTSPRGAMSRPFGVPTANLQTLPGVPIERHQGAYYIRLMVLDQPGVIADVAAAFARRAGIDGIDDFRRGRAPGGGRAGGADDPHYGRGGRCAGR